MVEVDMGSMPVRRPQRIAGSKSEVDLSKTSIMRKAIAYAQAYMEKQHRTELGWKSFRVLILTNSSDRAMRLSLCCPVHIRCGLWISEDMVIRITQLHMISVVTYQTRMSLSLL